MNAWVVSEIVNQLQLKTRGLIAAAFIRLALEFRKINNFNGVMEVILFTSIHSSTTLLYGPEVFMSH